MNRIETFLTDFFINSQVSCDSLMLNMHVPNLSLLLFCSRRPYQDQINFRFQPLNNFSYHLDFVAPIGLVENFLGQYIGANHYLLRDRSCMVGNCGIDHLYEKLVLSLTSCMSPSISSKALYLKMNEALLDKDTGMPKAKI